MKNILAAVSLLLASDGGKPDKVVVCIDDRPGLPVCLISGTHYIGQRWSGEWRCHENGSCRIEVRKGWPP